MLFLVIFLLYFGPVISMRMIGGRHSLNCHCNRFLKMYLAITVANLAIATQGLVFIGFYIQIIRLC